MKKLLPLCLVALCGCSTTNITKLVEAAAKDNAKVRIEVKTIYGTLVYEREMPQPTGTNFQSTVSVRSSTSVDHSTGGLSQ